MKCALTIGNFDGVHRGHRSLIEALQAWRRAQPDPTAYRTAVITFDPHPSEVLKGVPVPKLSTTSERTELLHNLGVDEVRVMHFTKDFAQTSAHDFFNQYIRQAAFVAIGHDFYYGHNREGTPGQTLDWCQAAGIPARLVEPVEADGAVVSSSRIRKLIQEGHMIAAGRLLGRDYSLTGEVIHGDKRGRLLGFPTANILPSSSGPRLRCVPARGVYLSAATVEGKTFASITNVGVKPTVSDSGQLIVETHLLDFQGDLYGKLLTVEFRDRLRDERKFSGLPELQEQIRKDIAVARERLITL